MTFDDGYRDNLEAALPILERYSAPAAIYVASGYVESGTGASGLPVCNAGEIARLGHHPQILSLIHI